MPHPNPLQRRGLLIFNDTKNGIEFSMPFLFAYNSLSSGEGWGEA